MIAALEPVEDFEKNAYALSAPNPPGIQIVPPSVAYDFAMSHGQDEWTFILQAFVPFTADTAAQRLLDQVCSPEGPSSVKALLEADKTLGGEVSTLRVVSQSAGAQAQSAAGSPMLLVEFTVQVFANGG